VTGSGHWGQTPVVGLHTQSTDYSSVASAPSQEWFTRASQFGGRSTGPGSSVSSDSLPLRSDALDQRQSSHREVRPASTGLRSMYRHTANRCHSSSTRVDPNRPWYTAPSPSLLVSRRQRRPCVPVIQCRKRERSPSCSGHSSKCQWFGIRQYATIRIGHSSRPSASSRSNAIYSSADAKSRPFLEPRLNTWYATPPTAIRRGLGMTSDEIAKDQPSKKWNFVGWGQTPVVELHT
jgi:hypothetical protein